MKEYSVAEHHFDHEIGQAQLRLVNFPKPSGFTENYWTHSRARAEAAAMLLELEVVESPGYDFVVVEREEGTKEWNEVTDNE